MPPCPKRYLFCHGNGRGGRRSCMFHVGRVQSLPWGVGRRGFVAFLALQRFGLKSSETQVGQPVRDKSTLLALSALCSPSLRVSAPGLLQLFTSRIKTQGKKNSYPLGKKRGSIHHSIYNTAKMSCQNKHTHTHKNTVNRKIQENG